MPQPASQAELVRIVAPLVLNDSVPCVVHEPFSIRLWISRPVQP